MKGTKLASRIKLALVLVVLGVMALIVGACKTTDPETPTPGLTQISGFDVEESISVNEKELVTVQVPLVTDRAGNTLDVIYEVTTTDGGFVSVASGRFFATDLQGYVIRYVAIGKDNKTYEKQTSVTVKSIANLALSAEYDVFTILGEETQIKPVCSVEHVQYTYSVVNVANETEINVTEDGKFTCLEKGWYEVTITANNGDKDLDFSYEVYCREAVKEGEVEVFGDDWETIRMLQEYGTYDARYTNTAQSGVKDRFGLDSECIVLETKDFTEYGNLYINPRGDEAYYRQLAEEGYTHISIWVYSACTIPHSVQVQLFPTKGLYTYEIGTVMPGQWTELKINIVEGKEYNKSCFAAAVGYYQNQETFAIQFDNTNGWNGPGGSYGYEENMALYIGDVYAVKPSGIEANKEAKTEYKTGETVQFDSLFNVPDGQEVQYAVTYRGKTLPASDNYTFKANGEYTVSVVPAKNLTCNETVTLTVHDDVVASVTSVQLEREDDSLAIELDELGVTFTLEQDTLTPTTATVALDGTAIAVTDNVATAVKDGRYLVEFEIHYGENYISYVTVGIDVWSEASKYLVSDAAHMLASAEYRSWDKQPKYEVGEYEIGGKTAHLKVTGMGEQALIAFKPVYSIEYYKALLEENQNYKLIVDWYIASESGISARTYTNGWSGVSFEYGAWNTTAVSLKEFIEDYDTLSAGYDGLKYCIDNAIGDRHSRDANDYLLWLSGAGPLKNATVYVANIVIVDKIEVENDGIWNDLTDPSAVTTTINPWSQAERKGLVPAAKVAELGGVEGKAYTYITAKATYFCYGGYHILPRQTIKDAWESYEDQDLVFDWYYDVDNDTEGQYNFNVKVYGASPKPYAQDTWHTSRIPMEDMLADWDNTISDSNNNGNSTSWTPWIWFQQTSSEHYNQSGTVYMGNIRFEEHEEPPQPDPDAVVVQGIQLVDVSETTELDLMELYTENGGDKTLEQLNALGLKVELTTAYGAKTTIKDEADLTKLRVDDLEKCVYTVELKTNTDATILTVTIDVYDAEDGLVWQDINEHSVSYAHVWKWGYNNVGDARFATVDGKNVLQFTTQKAGDPNTNEIGLRLQPLHSKAYYEAFAEDYESVTFDVYVTGGALNVKACDDSASNGSSHGNNTWKTYTVSLSYLLANWNTMTNITDSGIGGSSVTQLFTTYWGTDDGQNVISVGNFGAVEKVPTGGGEEPEEPEEGVIEGLVWSDLSKESLVSTTINPWAADQATRNGKVSDATIAQIGGKVGKAYTSVTAKPNKFCYAGYQIVPTKEKNEPKSDWEPYRDCYIVFDWYYDITGDTDNQYNFNVSVYGADATEYAQDTWHTSRVALADLLDNWDNVVAGSNNGGDSSPWTPWIKFKWTSANHALQEGTVYIGNLRVVRPESGGEEPEEPAEDVVEGLVWNNLSEESAVSASCNPWSQTVRKGKATTVPAGGVSGAAYTYIVAAAGWLYQGGYQIVPTEKSADFWQEYSDCILLFDWYYDVTDDTSNQYNYSVKVYGGDAVVYAQDTWHTSRIALSDLLANWTAVTNGANNEGSRKSSWTPWLDFQGGAGLYSQGGTIYLGNLRIVRPAE